MKPGKAAVFCDRDGVINELVPDQDSGRPESPYRPQDIALVPGATGALQALQQEGYRLIVASNQPAAAKGTATLDQLRAVHGRVVELLGAAGVELDGWRYCFHHPDGVVPELSGACDCRKPAPGMLLEAAAELGLDLGASWAVGDADRDVEAGRRAGCRTVLVEHSASQHRRRGGVETDAVAADLAAAAEIIIASDAR